MSTEKFFNTCVYGLVSMMSDFAYKKYGELLEGSRYVLWSGRINKDYYKGEVVNLAYRGIKMQFAIEENGLKALMFSHVNPVDMGRAEIVVWECIGNLADYPLPISKLEGLLTHDLMNVRTWNSGMEPGAVEIYIGV